MTTQSNPWSTIIPGSEKLVNKDYKYEFAWGVERTGEYALYIPLSSISKVPEIEIKHLSVALYKAIEPNSYVWVILLKNKEHWPIFKKLCEDLCSVSVNAISEKQLVDLLSSRLRSWQILFAKKAGNLTLEKQMGLFSELYFLDLILNPRIGIEAAINAWVGIEYDKQDFLLSDAAIEVKSFRASKGEIVTISSKEQLYSNKENLYLITAALTPEETGETIQHLVNKIKEAISQSTNSFNLYEKFQEKLLTFEYIDEVEDQLVGFKVDAIHAYRVTENFPRVLPNEIRSGIINLKYQIDLAAFSKYRINLLKLII